MIGYLVYRLGTLCFDRWIGAVLSYIRNSFGNKAGAVLAKDVAKSNINVLLVGETGTGKEILAEVFWIS